MVVITCGKLILPGSIQPTLLRKLLFSILIKEQLADGHTYSQTFQQILFLQCHATQATST